jgi:hypothetical protein
MNIHKEEVNNELIGTKNVKREVNPFKGIGYSMYRLLKHLKKKVHTASTEYLPISSTRPFAFQHL